MPRSQVRRPAKRDVRSTPPVVARSRRRAGTTADFLTAQPEPEVVHIDANAGEIALDRVSLGVRQQTARAAEGGFARFRRGLKQSVRFLRDELFYDPEAFFIKLGYSIGYGIKRFFKWFGSFSRFLLLPLSIVLIIGVMTLLSAYTLGVKVTLGGQVVGYIADTDSYNQVCAKVEESFSRRIGESFQIDQAPTYSLGLVAKGDLVSEEVLEANIATICEDMLGKSYGLFVDGALIGTYPRENAIYELLEAIKQPYTSGIAGENTVFMNNIEIVQDMYADQFELSISEMRAKLLTGSGMQQYSTKIGDTVQSICAEFDMSETVFYLLNPSAEVNEGTEGVLVTVSNDSPLVSVQVSKTITYEESLPFQVKTSISNDLWDGTKQIVSAGVAGITQFTAEVVVVDGIEISRQITNEVILREPVTQYELLGTKPISATGSFIWPVSGGGYITSRFGVRRDSGVHLGLDIAANRGTDILAADAGIVTVAGWSAGGFGYNVEIDHGNGLLTRYAHCYDVYVKVGQTVYQGQVIAGVGNTGYSFGNHCHFTVMIDGTYVNPEKFVSMN